MKLNIVVTIVEIQLFLVHVYCDVDVWLTVASTLNKVNGKWKQRLLELNWRNADNHKNDWIGLLDNDVGDTVKLSNALLVIQAENNEGKYRTEVEFPLHSFTKTDVNRKCLGFYIVYARLNKVLAKNCIRINPKWMEENYDRVGDRRITDMMIPGTHNAAAYYEGYKDTGIVQSKIDNYAICQDESVFNQLMYGIRYIDLRVMYGPEKQGGVMHEFWMAHDIFRMNNTLETILKDVRNFMDATSKEVVIVDFHRFPKGFDDNKEEKHQKIIKMIEQYLGPYLSTRGYMDMSVGELVNSGKRIVLGYAENNIQRANFMYPAVRQMWGDKDTVDQLHGYLSNRVCYKEYSYICQAAMAELTPQKSGVILNSYGGLRKMAEDVNPHVTKWFREEWAHCANIIASDYFLGNNIIEVSINNLKQRR